LPTHPGRKHLFRAACRRRRRSSAIHRQKARSFGSVICVTSRLGILKSARFVIITIPPGIFRQVANILRNGAETRASFGKWARVGDFVVSKMLKKAMLVLTVRINIFRMEIFCNAFFIPFGPSRNYRTEAMTK